MLFASQRLYRVPLSTVAMDPVSLWGDVSAAARSLGLGVAGALQQERVRAVESLDTRAGALAREGVTLLRLSEPDLSPRLRLRLCDDDRHIAGQTSVTASRGYSFTSVFQEEILPPFHSRFVHVCTVDLGAGRNADLFRRSGHERVFPLIRRVIGDEPLVLDRSRQEEQHLFTGAYVALPSVRGRESWASVAVILRARASARAGELTLRIGDRRERYDLALCRAARSLQQALVERPWCSGQAPHRRNAPATGAWVGSKPEVP